MQNSVHIDNTIASTILDITRYQEKSNVCCLQPIDRRGVKNLAFDTLPLEEVVKAFKDNKEPGMAATESNNFVTVRLIHDGTNWNHDPPG